MLVLWVRAHGIRREFVAAGCALVLIAFAAGTWERNEVWHTEESLWYDVTLKSPYNGRGLMNYGLTQMQKGENARALDYFTRALVFNPNYSILEINLGVVNGALLNDAEAERHFERAAALAPTEATSHYYYAVWLRGKGRLDDAVRQLNIAVANNPSYVDAPHLLMAIYAQQVNTNLLRQTATETLAKFPEDAEAKNWLSSAGALKPTADTYLNQSLVFYQQRKFDESIGAARQALELKPDSWEAWNNIAASYNSLAKWDDGIKAAQQAVRLHSPRASWQRIISRGPCSRNRSRHTRSPVLDKLIFQLLRSENSCVDLAGDQDFASQCPWLLLVFRRYAEHVMEAEKSQIALVGQDA